jgi:hypothetical protein
MLRILLTGTLVHFASRAQWSLLSYLTTSRGLLLRGVRAFHLLGDLQGSVLRAAGSIAGLPTKVGCHVT